MEKPIEFTGHLLCKQHNYNYNHNLQYSDRIFVSLQTICTLCNIVYVLVYFYDRMVFDYVMSCPRPVQ
jgi:hypothetical protein